MDTKQINKICNHFDLSISHIIFYTIWDLLPCGRVCFILPMDALFENVAIIYYFFIVLLYLPLVGTYVFSIGFY